MKNNLRSVQSLPRPRGFPWFFSIWQSCERTAKQWTQVAKQWERKTSGYFGLDISLSCRWRGQYLTLKLRLVDIFTNMQINVIGPFDWQYWWDGANIYQCISCEKYFCLSLTRKEFVCKQLQFSISTHSTWILFLAVFEGIWPWYSRSVFHRLKVSLNIKALLTVINRKDTFAILPISHGKSIIIQLIPDVGKYLYLTRYS